MTAYEPGTVALATVRGVPNVRVMRRGLKTRMDDWVHSMEQTGYSCSRDCEVTDIHPLIVIDSEDAESFGPAIREWTRRTFGYTATRGDLERFAKALRSLVAPSRPAEPSDPAARVIDKDGDVWASHNGKWGCLTCGGESRTWDALVATYGPLEIRP